MSTSIRVGVISDTHSEFYCCGGRDIERLANTLPSSNSGQTIDVLILAGDIGSPCKKLDEFKKTLSFYRSIHPGATILMVMGNHEYYGCKGDLDNAVSTTRKICKEEKVVLLDRETVTIKGVKFAGATMWSEITNYAFALMADKYQIFNGEGPDHYRKLHARDLSWILSDGVKDSDVFITHHLPSYKLIHPEFEFCGINSGFASHIIEDYFTDMDSKRERLWVCGHSHRVMDVKMDGFGRVVINPMGYPSERDRALSGMLASSLLEIEISKS